MQDAEVSRAVVIKYYIHLFGDIKLCSPLKGSRNLDGKYFHLQDKRVSEAKKKNTLKLAASRTLHQTKQPTLES
jgi:hypothetical protein